MFQTAPKIPRNEKLLPRDERDPLPPTQIGRALQELGIVWIAAHSPQAKGRVERSFSTAQDRLVKGLRVAGAATLEAANRYLDEEFVPWWNQHLVVIPANSTDAHRSLGKGHELAAILSRVETRQVGTDYTISIDGKLYRIEETSICTGLRRASIQIEWRLDGTLAARFRGKYLAFALCEERPVSKAAAAKPPKRGKRKPPPPSPAMRAVIDGLFKRPSLPIGVASKIDRTRTRQKLD
jgi:hypothetical protein